MPIIYAPKGKALEYSPLAANLYRGCAHGCQYCYVPTIPPFKFEKDARKAFFSNPLPRAEILQALEKEARIFAGDKRRILLSFTSDAYQPKEKELKITRQALEIMAKYNLKPQILTKAGEWAVKRDADVLLRSGCIWAATLTCDDNKKSQLWEPNAALPSDRIAALERAHAIGLKTWVSLEPVIDPKAAVRLIHETHSFVDLYKVGKLNHHPLEKEIDWADFLKSAEDTLNTYNKDRYIKIDLEKYRGKAA